MRTIHAAGAVLVATVAAGTAAAQWRTEVVGPGTKPELLVDAGGAVHVVFMIEDHAGGVYHATRDASGWTTDTVATGYFYGPLDVAADPDGGLTIAWHDHDSQNAAVASGDATAWMLEQVTDPGHDGWDPTLAVGDDGRVHLASIDPSQFGSRSSLEYAVRSDGGWKVEKIGSGPVPYAFGTAIGLDADGRPLVAWHDGDETLSPDGRLLLATRDPTAGWSTEEVDADGDAGKFPSLAVGDDGAIHLAAVVRTAPDRGHVRYAVRGTGTWQVETVAELESIHIGHVGARRTVSLVLDDAGRPLIAWCDRATLAVARRGADGSWTGEVVTTAAAPAFELGQLVSLGLAPDGTPHLAYYELPADPASSLGTVMYATRDRAPRPSGPVRRATGRVGGAP